MKRSKEEMTLARKSMIKALQLATIGCPRLAKKELGKASRLLEKQYKNS